MSEFPWRIRVSWWLISRLTPWVCSSQEQYFSYLEKLVQPGMRLLDVGCGKEFLMDWLRPDLASRWTASICDRAKIFGIDPYFSSLRANSSHFNACAFADHLPFAASSFDMVTANMVIEHVEHPDAVLQEVFRVLKRGGLFVFHTPNVKSPVMALSNVLPYSVKRALIPFLEGGREEEEVFLTHYRMNTSEVAAATAVRNGFRVEAVHYAFTVPFTQMMGPLVIFELLTIRMLSGKRFTHLRPDLICVLRKPVTSGVDS